MSKFPYFAPSQKYYDEFTEGMSEKMKQGLGNALAHSMIPIYVDEQGVWMTRADYLLPGKYHHPDRPKTSLVDREGKWHYRKEFEGKTS